MALIKYRYNVGDMVGNCIYLGEASPNKTKRQNVRCCLFECPHCQTHFKSPHNHVRNLCIISCGCLSTPEAIGARSKKHGKSGTTEFVIWTDMKQRCTNIKNDNYHNYGGKGVKMCDRWLNSFENFFADMGNRPSKDHSIDRYPNRNGNYEQSNCRWATRLQQANNREDNVRITFDSKSLTIPEWSRELGLSIATLSNRKKDGWSIERMFTEPLNFSQGRNGYSPKIKI